VDTAIRPRISTFERAFHRGRTHACGCRGRKTSPGLPISPGRPCTTLCPLTSSRHELMPLRVVRWVGVCALLGGIESLRAAKFAGSVKGGDNLFTSLFVCRALSASSRRREPRRCRRHRRPGSIQTSRGHENTAAYFLALRLLTRNRSRIEPKGLCSVLACLDPRRSSRACDARARG
jgi:hypothetical protein